MPDAPRLRAALYLRISQDRKGEGLAVDRQRQDGRRLIELRGWDLVAEHVDNDISAAGRKRRPGFAQLLDDVRGGRVDVVVAWVLDRLVRTARDRLALIDACRATNTSIALVRGSDIDLTTAAGRLTAGLLGEIAQHEIDTKSERQRRAIEQAAEQGKPAGGWRPFGFLEDGVTHHPVEAPVLVDMYARFLAGASCGELADHLRLRAKLTTTQGNRWTPKAVRVVLGNPRNAGLRGLRPTDPVTAARPVWHEQTWPAVWQPIVTQDQWRAAVALLRSTSRPGTAPGGNRYRQLLSGIAVCGVCGLPMISGHTGGGARGKAARIYTCTTNRHITRNAVALEDFLQGALMARLRRPDAARLLVPAVSAPQTAALRAEAQELRARLGGLAVDYAQGILDREQVRGAGEWLRARLATVDTELASAGRADVVAPLVLAGDDEQAYRLWQDYPLVSRREVLARVMRPVVLRGRTGRPPAGVPFDPATVRIEWLDG